MKWIVITSPDFLPGEAFFIDRLFCHGLDLLHLRKPGATAEACRRLLDAVPEKWHDRIVLHENFGLAKEYRLHGIHLNRRCPQAPVGFSGSISCSCHSIEEVAERKRMMDYIFLSPVFDSISKAGYEAAFSTEALRKAAMEKTIDSKVVALGGVTAANITQLREWHFGGAALLGDVWLRMDDPRADAYLDRLRKETGHAHT